MALESLKQEWLSLMKLIKLHDERRGGLAIQLLLRMLLRVLPVANALGGSAVKHGFHVQYAIVTCYQCVCVCVQILLLYACPFKVTVKTNDMSRNEIWKSTGNRPCSVRLFATD